MTIKTVAKYVRESTIWPNARTDKRAHHYIEMICEVINYDEPSDIEAAYGFASPKILVDGVKVHKAYKVNCKGVSGHWTQIGIFYDDRDSANNAVAEILNHPWYKGWKRIN